MFFGRNKRKFLRLSIHHLLRYKISGKPDNGGGSLSFVRNISAGGVVFHCDQRLEPGSILELQIKFPSAENFINAKAKVLRARPLKKQGGFDVAVQFIDLADETRKGMDKKLLNTYAKSKEEGIMKQAAAMALILGLLSALIGLSIKIDLVPVIFLGQAAWLKVTNAFLLFSIACSLLKR